VSGAVAFCRNPESVSSKDLAFHGCFRRILRLGAQAGLAANVPHLGVQSLSDIQRVLASAAARLLQHGCIAFAREGAIAGS
jgi:hypothetical protein